MYVKPINGKAELHQVIIFRHKPLPLASCCGVLSVQSASKLCGFFFVLSLFSFRFIVQSFRISLFLFVYQHLDCSGTCQYFYQVLNQQSHVLQLLSFSRLHNFAVFLYPPVSFLYIHNFMKDKCITWRCYSLSKEIRGLLCGTWKEFKWGVYSQTQLCIIF